MTDIRDLERLKTRIERLKDDISRSKGARDEAMRNLKEEFDVKNLSEAKKKLEQIITEEEACRKEFEEAFAEFEEKWGDRL